MSYLKILLGLIVVVVVIAAALPLFQTARDTGGPRYTLKTNLKALGIALHNYHDTYGSLPPAFLTHTEDKPAHGWLTGLLPFVEQQPVYEQIDPSKPWDDESQIQIFHEWIGTYWNPAIEFNYYENTMPVESHFAGNMHVIRKVDPLRFEDITDGHGDTIMLGEAFGNFEPWGKPGNVRDPLLGINKAKDGFGTQVMVSDGWSGRKKRGEFCVFGMVDGAARVIDEDIDPDVLRWLALPNDGEYVGEF